MYVLGIDPGIKGGLCILSSRGIKEVINMPLCLRLNRKGNYIDLGKIYEFITKYNSGNYEYIESIYIERQFISRSTGGTKTMYQSGLLYGLCFPECDNLVEINAKDWQKIIFPLVDKSKVKNYSYPDTKLMAIAYVEQNYGINCLFSSKRQSKPNDGLADAICIASAALLLASKN